MDIIVAFFDEPRMLYAPWCKWWRALIRAKEAVHADPEVVAIARRLADKIDTSQSANGEVFRIDEDFVVSLLRATGWLSDGRTKVSSRGAFDFSYPIAKPDDFVEAFYALAGQLVQETSPSAYYGADDGKRPFVRSLFGYAGAASRSAEDDDNEEDQSNLYVAHSTDTTTPRYYVRDATGSLYQAVELVDVFRRIGLLATMYFCRPWRFLKWLVVTDGTDARVQKTREDIALKLLELEPSIDVDLPKLSPRRDLRYFGRVVFFAARRCLDITAKHMEREEWRTEYQLAVLRDIKASIYVAH
jgi:hypothetical protein